MCLGHVLDALLCLQALAGDQSTKEVLRPIHFELIQGGVSTQAIFNRYCARHASVGGRSSNIMCSANLAVVDCSRRTSATSHSLPRAGLALAMFSPPSIC